ncbi:MAG: hypothetical protein JWN75_387 [Candidatus Saccharibacteria bacterium]|nr:hypothetical protein [Candidatus Saccharibacteria bacterium]
MKLIKSQTSKGPAAWFTGDVYPTILLAAKNYHECVLQPSTSRLAVERHGIHMSSDNICMSRKEPHSSRSVAAK